MRRLLNKFNRWLDQPQSALVLMLILIIAMLATPAPTGTIYCCPNPDHPGDRKQDWCQYVHKPASKDAALRLGTIPVPIDKVTIE